MLFVHFTLSLELGTNVLVAVNFKLDVYEVLHKSAGTTEQLVVVGNEVDESLELIYLFFLLHFGLVLGYFVCKDTILSEKVKVKSEKFATALVL